MQLDDCKESYVELGPMSSVGSAGSDNDNFHLGERLLEAPEIL